MTALFLLPTFPTVPQDRVMLSASFGAFGWIATAIVSQEGLTAIRHRIARVVLRSCHVWMAAVLFIPMLGAQYRFETGSQALKKRLHPDRIVVLINTPVELLANYALAMAAIEGERKYTGALHQLYAGGSELWVERTAERVIEVTATRGWGYVPVERIFCAPEHMPRVGEERRARGMTVRTLTTNPAGMPERVRFTFDAPLESAEHSWLVWTEAGHPVPFRPPGLAERVRLAPLNLLKALP